jgi:acetyltransferase-like isoleucine patch superfamily enzyme
MNPIVSTKLFIASFVSKRRNHYIGARFKRGRRVVLGDGLLYIGDNVTINDYARIMPYNAAISICDGVFIQAFCTLLAGDYISIGRNVLIGPHTVIVSANHRFDRLDIPIIQQGLKCAPIAIDDDCWIGASSVVLAGVKIGQGSIVGAGSVVTKNVAPYSIVAGNPAKLIRERG